MKKAKNKPTPKKANETKDDDFENRFEFLQSVNAIVKQVTCPIKCLDCLIDAYLITLNIEPWVEQFANDEQSRECYVDVVEKTRKLSGSLNMLKVRAIILVEGISDELLSGDPGTVSINGCFVSATGARNITPQIIQKLELLKVRAIAHEIAEGFPTASEQQAFLKAFDRRAELRNKGDEKNWKESHEYYLNLCDDAGIEPSKKTVEGFRSAVKRYDENLKSATCED